MEKKKWIIIGIAILFIIAILAFIYAYFIEPKILMVSEKNVKTGKNAIPVKVVFFSDTHFGKFCDYKNLEDIVEKINASNPDIIIFGGDFFDSYYKDQKLLDLEYIKDKLGSLNARYGKVAIWGNHEYAGGSIRVFPEIIESSGFQLIRNEAVSFDNGRINVYGVDDLLLGDPVTDIPESMRGSDSINIIASHAPDVVADMDLTGIDLALGGHSHGGQVNLPFITKMILPRGAKQFWDGMYRPNQNSDAVLIVSRGIGMTGLPFRFFAPPEINVINITP